MLYLVSTPIGNLEDISGRALRVLREADAIACEDTRRTRILLDHYSIPIPRLFISYREHHEEAAGARIVGLLQEGKKVALCSDGGTPGISDPGYRLIRLALENNIPFEVVPGACAALTALAASGLSSSSFTFKGFPPRKDGALRKFFEADASLPHTLILFESPFRVEHTLLAALQALGDRQAAVCIELTKKFERISRGFLSALKDEFAGKQIKGEVTIVIAGNNPKFAKPDNGEDE